MGGRDGGDAKLVGDFQNFCRVIIQILERGRAGEGKEQAAQRASPPLRDALTHRRCHGVSTAWAS